MWGRHCWKTYSTTQGAVALSSAEAEFYAMIEGVQRAKWAETVAAEIVAAEKAGASRGCAAARQ